MVEPLRHRQTKEAATDMFYLKPPRHISTLPHQYRSLEWYRLLGALPGHCRGPAGRRGRHSILQFVAGQNGRPFLLGSIPVGKRRALDLEGDNFVVDRVRTEV